MLKKLLTLSLVTVMLSTAVYAASPMGITLAAETDTEPVYEAITTTATLATEGDMDLIKITDTDGTQTAADNVETGSHDAKTDSTWFLAKIKIGNGYSLPLTNAKFDINTYGWQSSLAYYCVPLKKTDFDMAKATAGNGTALTSNLEAPSQIGTVLTTKTISGANWTCSSGSALSAALFTEEHYVDEYIYVAFQIKRTSTSGDLQYRMTTSANDYRGSWKMTVTGNKQCSVVTATDSAIYITDDLTGKQTVDVEAVTNGKDLRGKYTKWMIYKFTTGKTYEKISYATLNVTASKMTGSGYLGAYTATKEQWDAAYSIGDNSLTKTEQQTHFVSPKKSGTLLGMGSYAGKALEIDMKAKCEEQIKSGEVYVFVCAGSYNDFYSTTGNAGQGGTLESVTLTITGVEGDYEAPAVTDFDDSVLVWNKGSYGFYTTATSGKALLIAATYTGEILTDAEVITIDASEEKTGGGYTGTTALTPGDSLKVFLWNEGTLVPVKSEVIEF